MFKKHPTKMYIGKTCLMLIQGLKASGHSYFLSISSLDVLNMWLMWRILLGFTAFPLDIISTGTIYIKLPSVMFIRELMNNSRLINEGKLKCAYICSYFDLVS